VPRDFLPLVFFFKNGNATVTDKQSARIKKETDAERDRQRDNSETGRKLKIHLEDKKANYGRRGYCNLFLSISDDI
jgi:hypothetical protein